MKISMLTIGVVAALALSIGGAHWMRPTQETRHLENSTLEAVIPGSFGDWRQRPQGLVQVDLTTVKEVSDPTKGERPTYDEVVSRTYVNKTGDVVMLSLAYGRRQSQELRIHRPELCYYAQGFEVKDLGIKSFDVAPGNSIPVKQLLTQSRGRIEPVSYWIRIGDRITENAWQTRGEVFRQGLQGNIPDGMLVRVSTIVSDKNDTEAAFVLHQRFLTELYTSLDSNSKYLVAAR